MEYIRNIILGMTFILMFGCNSGIEEHYIIPLGYQGVVTVVFDEAKGLPIDYDDKVGARVYRIPSNGILITNVEHKCNIDNRKYFYKNERGADIEIIQMTDIAGERMWFSENSDKNDSDRNIIGAFMLGCGYKADNGYSDKSAFIGSYNQMQKMLLSEEGYSSDYAKELNSMLKNVGSPHK